VPVCMPCTHSVAKPAEPPWACELVEFLKDEAPAATAGTTTSPDAAVVATVAAGHSKESKQPAAKKPKTTKK
jgi:hypothetical protein